jgi:hypothetical protein
MILRREKLKRLRERNKSEPWQTKLVDSLFPKQAAFVLSPAKTIIGQCTRRAGKTHGAAARLLLAADSHAGSTALYLALTRKSAKRLLWPKLKQMARAYGIPIKFNESDLQAELANGSQIVLYGADQENMAERLRGDAYCIVLIDEAASFGENLEYTITDVVEPALLDFQGTLAMIGSPGPTLFGPFYDACSKPERGWEIHKWSVLDNTHLPHAGTWIRELKKRRGWSDDNPTYLREYCNVWTEDPDSLIYKYNPLNNKFQNLPDGHAWQYALGLDIGFDDPSSWSVLAFAESHPKAYVVHNEAHHGWTVSQVAERTQELQNKYRPFISVADCGALGKMIVEEITTRYGIPLEPAEKSQKMANIELMNGDFRTGRLLVHESLEGLNNQYRTLCKDRTGTREDPTLPNDRCDSTLYPWRHCRQYWYKDAIPEPEYGTEEYWNQVEQRQIEALVAQSQKEHSWLDELS